MGNIAVLIHNAAQPHIHLTRPRFWFINHTLPAKALVKVRCLAGPAAGELKRWRSRFALLLWKMVAAGISKSSAEERDHLVKFIDNDGGIFIVKSAGELLSRGEVGVWG